MATPILMPQVGQDLVTARITEWHVQVGDRVEESDLIVTVESDKATFEVEALEEGTVLALLFGEGEEAEVLKPIAYTGQPGEEVPSGHFSDPEAPEKGEEETGRVTYQSGKQDYPPNKILASPSAKRLAKEQGIALDQVQGSGPGGRIVKEDVEALLNSPPEKIILFDKKRKRIAERMSFSKQHIPHFYLFTEVDFTGAQDWRKRFNEEKGVKVTVNDLLVKALAEALREFPEFNAHVQDDHIILKSDINIGMAVDTPSGVLVPVVEGADRLDIRQISEVSREIADRARNGLLTADQSGTCTLSNLGMFGIDQFLPIINPPECIILSAGSLKKGWLPGEGEPKLADILSLGLACDHRAVDGSQAARFLARIKSLIEAYEIR